MDLNKLIAQVYPDGSQKADALEFSRDSSILETEIPDDIVKFITNLTNNQELSEHDFIKFHAQLNMLGETNPNLHDAIVGMTNYITLQFLQNIEKDIETINKEMEKQIMEGKELSFPSANELTKYRDLLNAYSIGNGQPLKTKKIYVNTFPGIPSPQYEKFMYDLPFAINSLILGNKLPKIEYMGLNLKKPFYPKTRLDEAEPPPIELKRGVKDADTYFPFKRSFKIAKGDVGDTVYIATNGKKILFLRGTPSKEYGADSILASKVAAFISKKHFSTERLLNKRVVASRWLRQYEVSVADSTMRRKRKDQIETQKKVFPGTGTIDEVLNFIQETDRNIENFGFSSTDLTKDDIYISKIDFDRCAISFPLERKNYEIDLLSKSREGIYKGLEHVQKDPNYIKEKLSARLKLSIMPDKLFLAMAQKAYVNEVDKLAAVAELVSRTKIALELFMKNKHAKDFLEKNPNILDDIRNESAAYINRHFDEKDQREIIVALDAKISHVRTQITSESRISKLLRKTKKTTKPK